MLFIGNYASKEKKDTQPQTLRKSPESNTEAAACYYKLQRPHKDSLPPEYTSQSLKAALL